MAWLLICVYYIPVRMHEITIQENDLFIRVHDIIIRAHDIITHAHDIIIRYHEIIIRLHDIIFRAHEITNWALDLIIRANGIRIHALDIINRMHEIIIRFHDIIIWAHNWTIYVNWLVYSSDSITKEPNGHISLTWVYVFLYKYVSVGNWQSPLLTIRIQVRLYTIFVEGHQKQFLPERFWTLINNLIGLSYMTTRRSPVGQSREEDKDQELIHDAARHCPV